MMIEKRAHKRIPTYAKVLADTHPGYLRNFDKMGCKILLMNYIPYEVNRELIVQIIPDELSDLVSINLKAQVCWQKMDGIYFLCGIKIKGFFTEDDEAIYTKLIHLYQ